jgi:hypothetical protein
LVKVAAVKKKQEGDDANLDATTLDGASKGR